MRENYPYSELLWTSFSRIRTELNMERYWNAGQNNSKYGHFLRKALQLGAGD